jgi:hypothetical protein
MRHPVVQTHGTARIVFVDRAVADNAVLLDRFTTYPGSVPLKESTAATSKIPGHVARHGTVTWNSLRYCWFNNPSRSSHAWVCSRFPPGYIG